MVNRGKWVYKIIADLNQIKFCISVKGFCWQYDMNRQSVIQTFSEVQLLWEGKTQTLHWTISLWDAVSMITLGTIHKKLKGNCNLKSLKIKTEFSSIPNLKTLLYYKLIIYCTFSNFSLTFPYQISWYNHNNIQIKFFFILWK